MKSWFPCLVLTLCASTALAEPPRPAPQADTEGEASALVTAQVLEPLRKAESKRKMFSRAAPVALERRVRVLDQMALTDVRGQSFVRFAVDVRRPWSEDAPWESDAMVGCVYPDSKEVFVQRGERFLPAKNVVGKDAKAVPNVCRAAPAAPAQTPPST